MTALDNLIKDLSKLPGIGPKSASRIAFYLIRSKKEYNKSLSENIGKIQDLIHPCEECGAFTEKSPCPICSDPNRNRKLLCIVEQPQDVITLNSSGAFDGLFHVLGGAINPLAGIGPEKLSFKKLLDRIEKENFEEIIIATNPTEEGDTTALFIRHILKDFDIKISRLASGLPIGGDLEYADKLTIARSLRSRTNF